MTESVPGVEPMVRVLLGQAIDDGLVDPADAPRGDPDPRARTAEELAGVAGILARYLRDGAGAVREAPGLVIIGRRAGAGRL
jgi:hypothetical protein